MTNPSSKEPTNQPHRRRIQVAGIPLGDLHGHVNPMLSFLTTLVARREAHATLIVTADWLRSTSTSTLVTEANNTGRIDFVMLDDLPPASGGAVDLHEFHETVKTEMVGPVERVLDRLEPPPDLILADVFLAWAVGVGERREVPVASFWPASASLFSVVLHHRRILAAHSFPLDDTHLCGEKRLEDLIPGIPSIRLADLPGEFQTNDEQILTMITAAVAKATAAQCIIFRTTNELEELALSALRTAISIPIYPIGPTIPYFTKNLENDQNTPEDYVEWLDTQRPRSVLYVSLGTCLPTLVAHVDELAAGVRESGLPFLWVAREGVSRVSCILGGKMGKVVSWCDQTRVLMHPCVGGFVTHCGWNSTMEAAFSGVPTLAFPVGIDQTLNSKIMVEDWGVGWRLKSSFQELVSKEKVLVMLNKFMDLESLQRKELDEKCKRFKERILIGVDEDGSTSSLDEFFLQCCSINN